MDTRTDPNAAPAMSPIAEEPSSCERPSGMQEKNKGGRSAEAPREVEGDSEGGATPGRKREQGEGDGDHDAKNARRRSGSMNISPSRTLTFEKVFGDAGMPFQVNPR